MDGEVCRLWRGRFVDYGWGGQKSKRGIKRKKIISFDVLSPYSALQGVFSDIPHPTLITTYNGQ